MHQMLLSLENKRTDRVVVLLGCPNSVCPNLHINYDINNGYCQVKYDNFIKFFQDNFRF